MAKQENKTAQAPKEQDQDNLSRVIRNGNIPTVEMSKHVAETIQKEKNERLAEQLKCKTLQAEYNRRRKLLQLRARRRESEVTKEFLVKAEVLQYQMAGFELTEERIKKMGGSDGKVELEIVSYDDNGEPKKEKKTFALEKGKESVWVPASITIAEFDELTAKNRNDEAKAKAKADADLQKDLIELEAQYPGYFAYSWRLLRQVSTNLCTSIFVSCTKLTFENEKKSRRPVFARCLMLYIIRERAANANG